MTANELFDSKFKGSHSIITGYKKEITDLMIEFAITKCKEQKRICYDEITSDRTGCYDSILYSPAPKLE